ncbi:MAG: ABC transporter permease subunit [Nitrosomonas sp.]|nr:ABC transporter permease subunit [Nitrosomonas sp.]
MNTTANVISNELFAKWKPAAGAIGTIARKELLELLRDARFWWTSGIILVLMLIALILGWQQMQRVDTERATARAVTYQQWLDQGDKNPHRAAHFGQYAFKPVSPLAFIDPGIDQFVGSTVWVEAHKQNEFNFRPARDATSLQRFGELTVAFGLQNLVPLVIVLLAFSAFTGERERGTLRQLLSIGVKPSQLLAGKGLAIMAVIGALLLPVALLGFIALGFAGDQHASLANLVVRGAWMVLGYALYLTGFIALALGASAALSSSRQALIVLLTFWVVNGFVAPRAMTDLARMVSPTSTKEPLKNKHSERQSLKN